MPHYNPMITLTENTKVKWNLVYEMRTYNWKYNLGLYRREIKVFYLADSREADSSLCLAATPSH